MFGPYRSESVRESNRPHSLTFGYIYTYGNRNVRRNQEYVYISLYDVIKSTFVSFRVNWILQTLHPTRPFG